MLLLSLWIRKRTHSTWTKAKRNARIEYGKQKRAYRISRTIWKYNCDKGLSKIRERERERERERLEDRMRGGTKQPPSAGVRTAFKVFYFERDVRGWETKGMGWRIKESRGDFTRRAEDLFIFPYFSLYFFPSAERDASISVAFHSSLCLSLAENSFSALLHSESLWTFFWLSMFYV